MSGRVRLDWRGDQVVAAVVDRVSQALGEFGLRAEGHSKRELQKGHGVLTGTLRRSIHTAQPGYNWQGDNLEPSDNSPERGGIAVEAARVDSGCFVQLGSGLTYALAVHQGHGSFSGYHYLTIGVDKARPELPTVLRRHRLM